MKKRILTITGALILVGAVWFGYAAIRAHGNLVTLDVRNAPLREVVRKIEWQTWETVFVQNGVDGKVTLNVKKMPLEGVLAILAEQTSSRWTSLYPLYSNSKSLVAFKQAVRGEADPSATGWSALEAPSFGLRGGMFGDTAREQNSRVTLQLEDKDLDVAAMALGRFAQAQIVPQDGLTGTVSLRLHQATFDDAVKQLAGKVRRNWTHYYALRSWRGGTRVARREGEADTSAAPTNALPWERGGEISPETRERMRRQFDAQLETMTPEERQRAEEMRQRMEEMRNLTPEQRRERMAEFASRPEVQERIQNRMLNGLKNSTPEQRVERDRRFLELRRRREQSQ